MALSADQKALLAAFAGRRLARFVALVGRTSTLVSEPDDIWSEHEKYHPAITAMWHGQFMLLPMLRARYPHPMAAMVARHGDAELIGRAVAEFDVELIRGAGAGGRQKDRGGAQAFRGALKALEAGTGLIMTADVPPGPARRAGIGIVTIARASGRPIVPIAIASSRFKVLDTWSRMTINLPYSRIAVVMGDPVHVSRHAGPAELEAKRREVETRLNEATARAYDLAGADIRPTLPQQPSDPPHPPTLGLKGYRAALAAFSPAAPLFLGWRARHGKEDPRRRGERLGHASMARPSGNLMWAHAASVGETNALLPVLEEIARQRPRLNILLTTGTVTSAGLVRQRLGDNALHQYVPIDAPGNVARFLDHWRPELAVFIESEIWPNTILELSRRGTPIALINARMSPRSAERWKRARRTARALFNRFAVVVAQSEPLARRFSELGARRVITAGNLKIDAPPPPVDAAALEKLRRALAGRPLFVAASTHEGEEGVIGEATRLIQRRLESICTIIAPRHPERGTGIAESLKAKGFTVAQRSLGMEPSSRTEIYIADTIGELGTFYALAPVAFIGGSLIERGGQNPIEAVRHGAAVLTGPHWANFPEAYQKLLRHQGALEVRSAPDLAEAVIHLSTDATAMAAMHAGANAALAELSGALARTVPELIALLPAETEPARAS